MTMGLSRSARWATAWLAAVGWATGCGAEAGDDDTGGTGDDDAAAADIDCGDSDPQLVCGTGDSGYQPLAEGDEVTIIHGPQGGWHLTGAFATANLGEYADITYDLTDVPSGLVVASGTARIAMVPEGECSFVVYNLLMIFDSDLYGPLASGEDLDTPCELFDRHRMRMRYVVTGLDSATLAEVATVEAVIEVVAVPQDACEGEVG